MTHCDRLLEVLSDGKPHDHHELYSLGMIVHSRVSNLRRDRGCVIEHWRDGDTHFYQLISGPTELPESNVTPSDWGRTAALGSGSAGGALPSLADIAMHRPPPSFSEPDLPRSGVRTPDSDGREIPSAVVSGSLSDSEQLNLLEVA